MEYEKFILIQIGEALQKAAKYGYDEPLVEPEDSEAYLQDILGFIKFNEIVNKFHRK
jgi:hypothetical protein